MNDVECLLIEDYLPDQLMMLSAIQTLEGVCVHTAQTWGAATRMMPRCDMLVVDLNLPDLESVQEAVDKVCRIASNSIPVIVLSGTEDPQVIEQCLSSGVVAYLRKDQTSPKEIREAVELAVTKTARRTADSAIIRLTDLQVQQLQ